MKTLQFYEAPAVEVVELKVEGFLCASTNAENANVDPIEFEDDED